MMKRFLPSVLTLMVIVIGSGVSAQIGAAELDLQALAQLHQSEAQGYSFYLDEAKQKQAELQLEPIFKWQNLISEGGQLGAIYVWSYQGRPEVLGTIFSQAEDGKRNVIHEFHTLSQSRLKVSSPPDVARHWQPKGELPMKPLDGAPAVADTPARRLIQMRALSREFTAYSHNGKDRVELRLATQPLIRYQPTRPDVQDGALFALLSSAAGTDPEVLLMIESRKPTPESNDWKWQIGIVRFSDRDLVVSRNDVILYSSINDAKLRTAIEDSYRWIHTPDETYAVFHAKFVPELTKKSDK